MREYFIDGYNFLFRIPTEKSSLEQKRDTLVDALNDALSTFKAHVSIIFDSSEQLRDFAQKKVLEHLDIIYAPKGKTADDYIIELVDLSKNPKIITVITSDNGLATQCSHMGAQIYSIEEFIRLLMKRKRSPSSVKPSERETPREMERLLKIFEKKLKGN